MNSIDGRSISNTHDGTVTVGTLRKEKEELEMDLLRYIKDKVREFNKETNYSPSSIEVLMYDITHMEDKNKQYGVEDVRVNVEVF